MSTPKIPLHIIGGGSIGLLLASSLRLASRNSNVKLLLREHHRSRLRPQASSPSSSSSLDQQQEAGINISLIRPNELEKHSIYVPAEIIGDGKPDERIDNLIVTTKAMDATTAVKSVLDRLSDKAKVIVLTNGALAVREELKEMLNESSSNAEQNIECVVATTTHGAHREEKHKHKHVQTSTNQSNACNDKDYVYQVVHAGSGNLWIPDTCDDVASMLHQLSNELNCTCISETEMEYILWEKLTANCVINPLTTLRQCKNGALKDGRDEEVMRGITQECADVANVRNMFQSHGDALSLLERFSYERLRSFVDQVIDDTVGNKSSMLQDLESGRDTEISYLNGFVSRMGKEYDIATPANDGICSTIDMFSKLSRRYEHKS